MNKKKIAIAGVVGLILTIIACFSSSPMLSGLAMFIYSKVPLGQIFLIALILIVNCLTIFLILQLLGKKNSLIYSGLIVGVYLVLNFYFGERAFADVDFSFLFK